MASSSLLEQFQQSLKKAKGISLKKPGLTNFNVEPSFDPQNIVHQTPVGHQQQLVTKPKSRFRFFSVVTFVGIVAVLLVGLLLWVSFSTRKSQDLADRRNFHMNKMNDPAYMQGMEQRNELRSRFFKNNQSNNRPYYPDEAYFRSKDPQGL